MGEETIIEAEATREAYNHNVDHHDGAGVEFAPTDVLTSVEQHHAVVCGAYRSQRRYAILGAVVLSTYALVFAWVTTWWWLPAIAVATFNYGMAMYRVGTWATRKDQVAAELHAARQQFGEGQ